MRYPKILDRFKCVCLCMCMHTHVQSCVVPEYSPCWSISFFYPVFCSYSLTPKIHIPTSGKNLQVLIIFINLLLNQDKLFVREKKSHKIRSSTVLDISKKFPFLSLAYTLIPIIYSTFSTSNLEPTQC